MEWVKKAEVKLASAFKDLPALPKSTKETLVQAWPWIALVLGVVQLAAAWALWRLLDVVRGVEQFTSYFSSVTGVDYGPSTFDKTMVYIGMAVLVVDAVILLMAFSPLRERARRGWDLVFLGSLINVAYSVIAIFINGRGFGSFILSLLGSAVGFYLLFQVRDLYGHKKPAKTAKA